MKIYDISQEVFSCVVYPGDDAPAMQAVRRTEWGDACNLTNFSMCAHNGTHVDAPFHFLGEGKTVEAIALEKAVGVCYVAAFEGDLHEEAAARLLQAAANAHPEAVKRILLKGNAIVTAAAAKVFAEAQIDLIGVESQSVGELKSPMAVHKLLLAKEVVLLEGIRLGAVPEGIYFLNAAPIALGGADGAPCRAILVGGLVP